MSKTPQDLLMVDAEQFLSREDALAKIQRERGFDPEIQELLLGAFKRDSGITDLSIFCFGAIPRARALYQGIVKEIEAGNPDAVTVLMRQFVETIALVVYVSDYPRYAKTVVGLSKDDPTINLMRKMSPTALLDYCDMYYTGNIRFLYEQLSQIVHFETAAVWRHFYPDGDETRFRWSTVAQYDSDADFFQDCAQALELGGIMATFLQRVVLSCLYNVKSTRPEPRPGKARAANRAERRIEQQTHQPAES